MAANPMTDLADRHPPTRRDLLKATMFLGVGATAFPALAADDRALSFLVIGDWGRAGDFHQRDVGVQMGRVASASGSKFTVSVGDNFYEHGVASVDDPIWRTDFEDIYTAPSLQTPWRAILGNHDYHGDSAAQIAYSKTSHRWRMPARYWNEVLTLPDGAKAEFFFTDTSPFLKRYWGSDLVKVDGQDWHAQLAWLESRLSTSTADWKIIFGHHPLFTDSQATSEGGRDIPEMIANFKPLIDRYGVQAYFNGHDHNQQHLIVDKTSYICSGAGSKTNPTQPTDRCRFASDHSGFTAVKLSRHEMVLTFVDYQGETLASTTVSRT